MSVGCKGAEVRLGRAVGVVGPKMWSAGPEGRRVPGGRLPRRH